MGLSIDFTTVDVVYFYKITNKHTDKCYIGRTNNPTKRFNEHLTGHGSNLLLADVVENGIKFFKFEVIHTCDIKEDLDAIEDGFIDQYNCLTPVGFNQKRNKPSTLTAVIDTSHIEITGKFVGIRDGIHTWSVGELGNGRSFQVLTTLLVNKPSLALSITLKKHFKFRYYQISVKSDNVYIKGEICNLNLKLVNTEFIDTAI
jgi:hypothetical protein